MEMVAAEGEAAGKLILPWISRIASPAGVCSSDGSGLGDFVTAVRAGEV